MRQVLIGAAALEDLREAESWFEERSPELGSRFLKEAFAVVDQIQSHPEMFRVVYRGLRQASLARFDYHIIYRVSDETIALIAIAHAKRKPRFWASRVSDDLPQRLTDKSDQEPRRSNDYRCTEGSEGS